MYRALPCKTDGTPNEETPAPDGEEYFAMALLFAGNRWPGGHGIYDYHAEANRLLTAMVHRDIKSGPTKFGERKVGPEVSLEYGMILFVPGIMPQPFTDPSYHLPAFYELWSRHVPGIVRPSLLAGSVEGWSSLDWSTCVKKRCKAHAVQKMKVGPS